jgi:hypothetical protein
LEEYFPEFVHYMVPPEAQQVRTKKNFSRAHYLESWSHSSGFGIYNFNADDVVG